MKLYPYECSKYTEFMKRTEAEKKALLLIGDKQAEAWAWINAYADQLSKVVEESYDSRGDRSVTASELIDTAFSHLGDGWGEYIVRGGAFEGVGVDPLFWPKFQDLIGVEIPQDSQSHFFSCSC